MGTLLTGQAINSRRPSEVLLQCGVFRHLSDVFPVLIWKRTSAVVQKKTGLVSSNVLCMSMGIKASVIKE